jgi:hypothetical protein
MSKFEPHWEVLPPEQREIWPLLAASFEVGLVLYGARQWRLDWGTGLLSILIFLQRNLSTARGLRVAFHFSADRESFRIDQIP